MRVFIAAFVTATALLVTACSVGTEDTTLQRGRSASSARAPGGASGPAAGDSNATSPPSSPAAPAPPPPPAANATATNDAGASTGPASGTTPAPAPAALGSCGNPKCVGGNGLAGCKATDGAGDVVTMGCQDGACACFAGGQATAEFDGDVNSPDDAAQLFLANCTCH